MCVSSCMPATGDLACNPGMYPDWESNWWPFGSQTGTQSTEPHQPGLILVIYFIQPNVSKIIAFQHVINVKLLMKYLHSFFTLNLWNPSVCFTLKEYLNSD